MKKITILVIILTLVLTGLVFIRIYNENKLERQKIKEKQRYEEIRNDIDKELERYIYIIAPHCNKDGAAPLITHKDLVYNAGMNKEKFLDVDGKSYCKTTVKTKCVDDGKWQWKIYLSCKNYEDKGYVDWDYGF